LLNSQIRGYPRCAIARAAATIEVKSISMLPFGSAGLARDPARFRQFQWRNDSNRALRQ